MPKVAVIIPCYNGARYLEQTLQSALEQSLNDKQILAVDDGSCDETLTILERFSPRVKVLQQSHQGTQAARNLAIRCSDSEYVALLDQDDLWLSTKLTTQVKILEDHPEVGLCYTNVQTIDERGAPLDKPQPPFATLAHGESAFLRLLEGNFITASSVVLRRAILEKVGLFSSDYPYAGDWHLWLRVATFSSIDGCPEVLTLYRWHSANASRDSVGMLKDGIRLYAEMLGSLAEWVSHHPGAREHPLRRRLRYQLAASHSALGKAYAQQDELASAATEQLTAARLYPTCLRFWSRWIRVKARQLRRQNQFLI